MNGFFSVKNFEKFQHYKRRSPPWIRLYNALLDDYEFGRLQDASKAHLIAIWLLASRYDNKIPFDPEWVSRRINATEPVDLSVLAEGGFIVVNQGGSKMLARCKQSAPPEESRAETEKRRLLVSQNQASGKEPPPEPKPNGVRAPRQEYPDKFLALWDEHRVIGSPNSSKFEAFKAWGKLDDDTVQRCYAGYVAYSLWTVEHKKKMPDYQPKHLATFINKRGWEPFEDAEGPEQ